MNKTKISWCDYTWNPVTGCRRGCEYCYARKIHNRFGTDSFANVVFHSNRLNDPIKVRKPSTIFVGSMSDIEYWEKNWIGKILDVCVHARWHTFMFLSKSPLSYSGKWPENTMQGLTVEQPGFQLHKDKIFKISKLPRPFLSIEPIMGGLWFELPDSIELVIVGAMTGNMKNKVIPQKYWIQSIKDHVPEEKIHWKENIKKYL